VTSVGLLSASHLPTVVSPPQTTYLLFLLLAYFTLYKYSSYLLCVFRRSFAISGLWYVAAGVPCHSPSSHGPYVGGVFFSDQLPSYLPRISLYPSFSFYFHLRLATLYRISARIPRLDPARCSTCGVSVAPSRRHGTPSIQPL